MDKKFTDPVQTIQYLQELYGQAVEYLSIAFEQFLRGELSEEKAIAYYPQLTVKVKELGAVDPTISYGFFVEPGTYSTTITRPHLFHSYLVDQLEHIARNHPGIHFTVGISDIPIPIKFVPKLNISQLTDPRLLQELNNRFTGVDNSAIDDAIADGHCRILQKKEKPLHLFTAPRTDIALERLAHYTGTLPECFQSYILFTNYQMHIESFCEYITTLIDSNNYGGYRGIAHPGGVYNFADGEVKVPTPAESALHAAQKQMPAYHLIGSDNQGITMINIGVGPSNAKTITDSLAVLRPQCWIMIGHCAGLDSRMKIKDLILANAYYRQDRILDDYVSPNQPIPNVSEIQIALAKSAHKIKGVAPDELKSIVRTGTVMTTADRNWEWQLPEQIFQQLNASAAIAVDMESATIATNGYRYRIPYGALLSVSDMPLHNQPKMPQAAAQFYENTKLEHVMIAVEALQTLAADAENIHSRKLRRTMGEVPFR